MAARAYSLIVTQAAKQQLRAALKFVHQQSVQGSEKMEAEILASFEKIMQAPMRFPVDKYKNGNDGSIRAYEVMHHRISYQVKGKKISIVRIRHTRQNPQSF